MSRIDITYCGVDLSVEFDYEEAEAAEHYGPAPHPGSPAKLEVCAVLAGSVDITELLTDETIDGIAQKVLEKRL